MMHSAAATSAAPPDGTALPQGAPIRLPPFGRLARGRRAVWLGAPVDGAEHVAVTLFLIVLLVGTGGLAIAGMGWFHPVTLAATVVAAVVVTGPLALSAHLRSRGVVPALAVASIVTLAGILTLPPAQFVFGGWDAGVYLATGADLARTGGFRRTDPYLSERVPEARAAVVEQHRDRRPYLFPGFYLLADAHAVIPQFPMMLSVWTGVGMMVGGPIGGLLIAPFVGAGSLALFFLLVRRASGGRVAAMATLLLGTSAVHLWHSTLTLSEPLLQGTLWGALLAGLLAMREPRLLYAISAGLALGLLPAIKSEAAVLTLIAAASLTVGYVSRSVPVLNPFLLATAAGLTVSLVHFCHSAWLYAAGLVTAAPAYLALGGSVLVGTAAAAWVLTGKQRSPSEFSPPGAVLWAVTPIGLAIWMLMAAREGHPLAPIETLTALWQGSYLSLWDTAVLLVGLAAVLRGGIPRVRRAEPAVVLGTLAAGSVLYAGIYAMYVASQDHLPLYMWATRRLLPTLVPLLAVLEAAALVRWLRVLPGGRGPVLLAAGAALTLARMPDASPLLAHREYAGALEQVGALAQRTEPDAVVFFDADDWGMRLSLPLRSLFGRDSYIIWNPAATSELTALLSEVRRDQRPVYYITALPGPASAMLLNAQAELYAVQRIDVPELERVSDHRPYRTSRAGADVAVYRVFAPQPQSAPPLTIRFGQEPPGRLTLLEQGFYPGESDGRDGWRWTGARAVLLLPEGTPPGARLTLRLAAGSRPEGAPDPQVAVFCKGDHVLDLVAPEQFSDRAVALPHNCGAGDSLVVAVTPWRPADYGGLDQRQLGIRLAQVTISRTGEDASRP